MADDSSIEVHVVSAEAEIYNGRAKRVSLPSVRGELGILPRHTPLLAALQPGEVRVVNLEGEEEYIYVSGGMAEIQPFAVTVLADTALRGGDVDEKAALEAKRRAEETIETSILYSDRDRAHQELLKALAQLKALEHFRRRKSP